MLDWGVTKLQCIKGQGNESRKFRLGSEEIVEGNVDTPCPHCERGVYRGELEHVCPNRKVPFSSLLPEITGSITS